MDPIEVEIFASGKHPDSQHPDVDYTPEWLRERARIYNAQYPKHIAPHTLGHPTAPGAPAYGWTAEVFTRDEVDAKGNPVTKLVAKVRDYNEAFWVAVKAGLWRERSVGFRNGLIDHVAWLGAELPAVKGLAPITFAEFDEVAAAEQGGYLLETIKNVTTHSQHTGSFATMDPQEMKDMLTAILSAITELGTAVKAALPDAKKADATAAAGAAADAGANSNNAAAQPDETEAVKQLRAEFSAQLDAQKAETVAMQAKADTAEFTAFLDSEPMKRRLTTAIRAEALKYMQEVAPHKGLIEFTAGKPKMTMLEHYKNTLKALPVLRDATLEGEFAQANVDDNEAADANDPNARGLAMAQIFAAKSSK